MRSLSALAMEQGGVFLRRQARECGFSDEEVRAQLRAGEWIRLRRGAYCLGAARLDNPGDEGWHRLVVRAVLLALEAPAVVSHVSAAALAQLPLHRAGLDIVHVTRPGHAARTEGGVDHHDARLDPHELEQRPDGVWVTSLARTVLDVSRTCTIETGIVAADSALNRGLGKDELRAMLESVRDWTGARLAARVVEMADGRAESVGESLMRYDFTRGGLPTPELQVEFRDERGIVWARVDALFAEERTIVEFDGRMKYDDPTTLWREKLREDRLRELGYEVVRVTWSDLGAPAALATRIRAAFARGRRRAA